MPVLLMDGKGDLSGIAKPGKDEEETDTKKSTHTGRSSKEESIFDNPIVKIAGRTVATIITRRLLGL